jgi:hypothetical protein
MWGKGEHRAALAGLLVAVSGGLVAGPAHAQATDSAAVPVTITIEPIAEIRFPDGFNFYIWVPEKKKDPVLPTLIPFKIRGNALATVTAIPDAFLRVKNGPWLGKAVKVSWGGHDHDDDDHDWDWNGWNRWRWDDWGRNGHHGENSRNGGHGHDDDCDDRHRNRTGKGHDDHGNGNGYGHDDCDDHGGGSGPKALAYNAIVRFPVTSWSQLVPPNWTGYATSYNGANGLSSLPGQNNVGTRPLTANVAGQQHGRLGVIFIISKRNWTTNGKDAEPGKYRGTLVVTVTADDD